MNKRILIVRKYKGFGGVEYQILTIATALMNNGWVVFFLTDQASPFERAMNQAGTKTIIHTFDNQFNTARRIITICKNNNIKIIQAHMLNEDFSCRLAKLFCPGLKHVFRVHTYIDCSRISQIKKNIYHVVSFVTDPLVNIYLPINCVNAKELHDRSIIPKRKIMVVHDTVRKMERSSQDYSTPKNRRIAMIANFEDGKGHDVLLEGVRILKEKGEKVFVHLIGGVPGRGTKMENTHRLDIVKKTIRDYDLEDQIMLDGFSDDIPFALKDCGIVVLPSDSEGTPNCLLEGMALGKIVIASAVGGIPEFVVDGKTGFLHEPGSGYAFAEAMIRVFSLTDKELENIIDNARDFVNNHFSIDNIIEDFNRVYSALL